jgi:uncharacterized protein involved in exopolysaccharide biosynthesis
MTTETKTRKKPEKVLTFEELNTKKLREKIELYRSEVARAATGEMLSEKELEAVGEALAFMHLPDLCWARDIQALRDYREAAAAAAEMAERRPELEAEAATLVAKVKQLEEELKQTRARLNYCGNVSTQSQANQMRRKHELETVHPHLLADLDLAMNLRAEARGKAHAKQVPMNQFLSGVPAEGWST